MGTGDSKIEELGEFGFIRSIQEGCEFSPKGLVKGIGDDCAVIGPYDGKLLLITTDLLIEDVHFTWESTSPRDLGEKAAAVNLSDIAAMGGRPAHLVVSVAAPGKTSIGRLHEIYEGIRTVCKRFGVNIVGGDTAASPEHLMLSVTVLGEAPEGEVLYRCGARPGDHLYVTGTLGDAAAGLMLLQGELALSGPHAAALREAHTRPVPFVEAGRVIAGSGLARAMIDLSDGLLADLGHICEASSVGARLEKERIPVSEALRAAEAAGGVNALELALGGGEDYRLLVAIAPQNSEAFEAIFAGGSPCTVFEVGEIIDKEGIWLYDPEGRAVKMDPRGYEHFRRS